MRWSEGGVRMGGGLALCVSVYLDMGNEPQRHRGHRVRAHTGLGGGWRRLPRLGGPLSAAGRRGGADLEVAQSRKAAKSSAEARALGTSRPSAPARDAQPNAGSRRWLATPQSSWRLGGLARDKQRRPHHRPLEEPIAAKPGQVAQSRRAAESSPQARALGTSRPSAPERDAQNHVCVAPTAGPTPNLSAPLRLCARQTTPTPPPPARRADRRQTRTGRAEPQSRREFTSSAGVGDLQTVGTGAGRPAQRLVTAMVGDTPELLAAWRLGATKTTPTPPQPARRADRRHTRTGRAKPQSRKELGTSAGIGDFQTVRTGAGRPGAQRGWWR